MLQQTKQSRGLPRRLLMALTPMGPLGSPDLSRHDQKSRTRTTCVLFHDADGRPRTWSIIFAALQRLAAAADCSQGPLRRRGKTVPARRGGDKCTWGPTGVEPTASSASGSAGTASVLVHAWSGCAPGWGRGRVRELLGVPLSGTQRDSAAWASRQRGVNGGVSA